MREVGAVEAENTLSVLLDLAESGEKLVIIRDGKEVARLVPPRGTIDREAARQAAQRIRDMSKVVALGGRSIRDMINEGRR